MSDQGDTEDRQRVEMEQFVAELMAEYEVEREQVNRWLAGMDVTNPRLIRRIDAWWAQRAGAQAAVETKANPVAQALRIYRETVIGGYTLEQIFERCGREGQGISIYTGSQWQPGTISIAGMPPYPDMFDHWVDLRHQEQAEQAESEEQT